MASDKASPSRVLNKLRLQGFKRGIHLPAQVTVKPLHRPIALYICAAFGVDPVSYNAILSFFGLRFWCEDSAKIVICVIVLRVLL